jgi:hypothetical protein
MTDKQPEALRLADELDCRGMNRPSWKDQFDAGYELRRLHEVNAELVEALEKLARLGNADQYGNSLGNKIAQEALRKAQGDNND